MRQPVASAYRITGTRCAGNASCSRSQDFTHEKGRRNQPMDNAAKARNRTKSKVRARVEHIFAVIKRVFGFTKVRYRGLDKNANALFVLCALTNLYQARRRLRYQT